MPNPITPKDVYAEIIGRMNTVEFINDYQNHNNYTFRVKVLNTLVQASTDGNIVVVNRLLDQGINFNPDDLIYPLCVALLFGHGDVVDRLLSTNVRITDLIVAHAYSANVLYNSPKWNKRTKIILRKIVTF
jgi:hypothetical protein